MMYIKAGSQRVKVTPVQPPAAKSKPDKLNADRPLEGLGSWIRATPVI
jgi:hypothetical protein